MTFTVARVAQSLADYLAPSFQGVAFYEDPNQQGTSCPCFFLQQRYSYINLAAGGRRQRIIGLDLTYLEQYNLPDLQQKYQAAAEILDLSMDTFPYSDGENSVVLRAYDREWRIDEDALHYKFELRVWIVPDEERNPMEQLDETITSKEA